MEQNVKTVGQRPQPGLSAQGWGRPYTLLRPEPFPGPRALPPPVRPGPLSVRGAKANTWLL